MPYNTSALRGHAQAGDPFLGGLIKGALKVGGAILPGPLGAGARILGGALGGKPQRQGPGRRRAGLRIAPMPVGGFGLGAVAGRAQAAAAAGGAPRRRRMNYSNQRALRRSLRRVTGYARQQKSIKKAAAEFAREFGPKRSRTVHDHHHRH